MNECPSDVMIFAAGFGTRMGALTKETPKPLIPVAGVPMIDRALTLVKMINPTRIVANVHYHADQLTRHLSPKGVILSQESEILETGGGLRKALPLLGCDTVFTVNPDVIWDGPNPLIMLRQAWNPKIMDALLMCVPIASTQGYWGDGDFAAAPDGRIQRGRGLVYGGVQITKVTGLNDIPQASFSLNLLWDQMLAKNRLYCAEYAGLWCDVGTPQGIEIAESILAGS